MKSDYYGWLHSKLCAVCGRYGIEVHHITHKSLSPRRDDLRVIPLCPDHHRGNNGIHTLGLGWYDKFIPLDKCLEISTENYRNYKDKVNV